MMTSTHAASEAAQTPNQSGESDTAEARAERLGAALLAGAADTDSFTAAVGSRLLNSSHKPSRRFEHEKWKLVQRSGTGQRECFCIRRMWAAPTTRT